MKQYQLHINGEFVEAVLEKPSFLLSMSSHQLTLLSIDV
jgi:hypothetical protein